MDMEPQSIISHLSLGTNDFERAVAFYDRVLEPLGCRRIMEHPGAVAYGRQFPEFWVQTPIDGLPATRGNGTHVAFIATSAAQVDAFYTTAIAAGGDRRWGPGRATRVRRGVLRMLCAGSRRAQGRGDLLGYE